MRFVKDDPRTYRGGRKKGTRNKRPCSAETRAARSIASREMWTVQAYRDHIVPRTRRRVIWSPEMDAMLRALWQTMRADDLRKEGARKIGVGERALRTRLKVLGLSKKGNPALWVRKPRGAANAGASGGITALYRSLGLSGSVRPRAGGKPAASARSAR